MAELSALKPKGESRKQKGESSDKLRIPNDIGIGTQAWGDTSRGFLSKFNPADLQGLYNEVVENGITYFDTSETFGARSSTEKEGMSAEQLIGRFAGDNYDATPQVATAFSPRFPRYGSSAVVKALEGSLERSGLGYVDVYQVSLPLFPPYLGGRRALYKGLAKCKQRGLCNAVGVVGFSAKQVQHAHAALAELGVPLVSNQVQLSLLDQKALQDGTVDACKRLGVTVLAGSPLKQGLASARYTATNPTGGKFVKKTATGPRGQVGPFSFLELRRCLPLHTALASVARSVGIREEQKVTPAQVALNWVVAKGAVPLPGVTSVADAREVLGCIGWRLRAADMQQLEDAVEEGAATRVKLQRVDQNYNKKA